MSAKGVLEFFDAVAPHLLRSLETEITPDKLAGVVVEARQAFVNLLPDVPYVGKPNHTMAESMFFSAVGLAFLEPVRTRGFDLHCVGRAIYDFTKQFNDSMAGSSDPSQSDHARQKSKRESEESHQSSDRREFVWEIIEAQKSGVTGYNVTSCAICGLYGKYDAKELVSYLCAGDDLVSDAYAQGLRRTGTIALGASKCDFRFHRGEPGHALTKQHLEKIKLLDR